MKELDLGKAVLPLRTNLESVTANSRRIFSSIKTFNYLIERFDARITTNPETKPNP
ncbi:MAG: hypothetical protein AB1717_01445 [Pseudomonadota bacterium]